MQRAEFVSEHMEMTSVLEGSAQVSKNRLLGNKSTKQTALWVHTRLDHIGFFGIYSVILIKDRFYDRKKQCGNNNRILLSSFFKETDNKEK